MQRIPLEQFLSRREEFDRAVVSTPETAIFCSQTPWQRAAIDNLASGKTAGQRFIIEEDENWLLFAEREGTGIFYPWESSWMFGSPLIGEPTAVVDLLFRVAKDGFQGKVGFCLGGVRKEGLLYQECERRRSECLHWEEFSGTDCMIIDLNEGFDAWLQRRSPKFRKSMRQLRVPSEVNVKDVSSDAIPDLLQRVLEVQKQTYKWKDGTDIFLTEDYRLFYAQIMTDLQERNRLRVSFVSDRTRDVAFQVGGLYENGYRGLQMSYIEEARSWGLGNWLQLENLRRCAEEGITEYDLGMHSPYKERWADRQDEYRVIFVVL